MTDQEKIEHKGGGVYKILGYGESVRGRQNALNRLAELKAEEEANKSLKEEFDLDDTEEEEDVKLEELDDEMEKVTLSEFADEEIKVDLWQGYKNYHCPYCPFASLKKDQLADHVEGVHLRKETTKTGGENIIRVDKQGNPIEREEE